MEPTLASCWLMALWVRKSAPLTGPAKAHWWVRQPVRGSVKKQVRGSVQKLALLLEPARAWQWVKLSVVVSAQMWANPLETSSVRV